jgi:hypothetical protein
MAMLHSDYSFTGDAVQHVYKGTRDWYDGQDGGRRRWVG